MYWWVEAQLHTFLTSALDGGEWSASRPGRFTPRESAPGASGMGGWVGPRACLDTVVKSSQPPPGIEPFKNVILSDVEYISEKFRNSL
jgi:hypothetical protein